LQQWLSESQAEATLRARGTCDLAYVFSPRALHDGKSRKGKALPISGQILPQRLAVAVWIWGQRGNGQTGWQQPAAYQLRNGQMPLEPVDRWLVRRMDPYSGDFDTHTSPKGPAGSDWVEKAIATGRARWRKADGPILHWGQDQTAQWCWTSLANGEQRPSLEGLTEGQLLLATAPPIIVDDATGTVHRVAGISDPALAQRVLLMPPVPPDAVGQLATHWENIAGADIPAPTLGNLQDLGAIKPVPVLTFVQEKVDAIMPRRRGYQSSPTYKADMACARICFDYAGYSVTPSANAAEIISSSDAGFIRFSSLLKKVRRQAMPPFFPVVLGADRLPDWYNIRPLFVGTSFFDPVAWSGGHQFGDSDQIVGDDIEQEVAGDVANASVLGLAQCAVLFAPSEHAFDEFAAGLRHGVTGACGHCIRDDAGAPLAGFGERVVAGNMRSNLELAQGSPVLGDIVSLVLADRCGLAGLLDPGREQRL
jgi:hypothetical protein